MTKAMKSQRLKFFFPTHDYFAINNRNVARFETIRLIDTIYSKLAFEEKYHRRFFVGGDGKWQPTEEQKQQYKEFVLSLGNVLPCGACRNNYKENLKSIKLTKQSLKNIKRCNIVTS